MTLYTSLDVGDNGAARQFMSLAAYEDEQETDPLYFAKKLADVGIPLFGLQPAMKAGKWNPSGGTSRSGYWFPKGWAKTEPFADVTYSPGYALGAVMGCGLDLIDVDPRNGGEASYSELVVNGLMPKVYAEACTPSGGKHYYVASMGVASLDNFMPGIDIKAGLPNGKGRGFAWIAPTRRVSKTTGDIATYTWAKWELEMLGFHE